MPIVQYVRIVLYLLAAAAMTAGAVNLVHMLQLEGYRNRNFFNWLRHNAARVYALPLVFSIAFLIIALLAGLLFLKNALFLAILQAVLLAAYIALTQVYAKRARADKAKKPLVYTGRVKRLLVLLALYHLIVLAALYLLDFVVLKGTVFSGVFVFTALLFMVGGVFFANTLAMPGEALIKKWYFGDAKNKLAQRDDLIRIGITGSFGKTSCKFILGTLLSEKYNVLVPPSSYNTPMGLTRVIREQMQPSHEVFIAEMGARHIGDIRELCGLVHPTIGIITSVGPAHLETFGSLEHIAKTKYELIESLPEDGCAFFPADNPACLALYQHTAIEKHLFSVDYDDGVYVRAANITAGPLGSRFDLIFDDGPIECETRLLGKHNIENIAGCAGIAKRLGLTPRQIRLGIRKLEPVEHRLQLLPSANGIAVIDDAFNANPFGVRAAMEVLSTFDGRKIVVTPGMVELGEREDAENFEFGSIMAGVADLVFLIGPKHTQPICDGLLAGGFDRDNIRVYRSLDEATQALWPDVRPGDVLLFENDLPDNYNE